MTQSSQTTTIDNSLVLTPFRSWLIAKGYSSSTIRNYISDTNQYFDLYPQSDIFSSQTVSEYLKSVSKDSNYRRYFSSLVKFFQFALDQNLIKTDPLKAATKIQKPTLDITLTDYQAFLTKKHFSLSTIKNYLNDIQQFIDWSKTNFESK